MGSESFKCHIQQKFKLLNSNETRCMILSVHLSILNGFLCERYLDRRKKEDVKER